MGPPNFQPFAMVIQDVSDLLGEYMLAGWILSDKSCEEDNIPLMKDKKTGEYMCVSCDILKKKEPVQAEPKAASLSSAETSSPVIVQSHVSDAEDDLMWESFTPTPHPHQEQSDRAASLISQKLLSGWTLLAESCQNSSCHAVPLMRKRGDIPMQCVICDKLWQHGPKGSIVTYPSNRGQTITSPENAVPSFQAEKQKISVQSVKETEHSKSEKIGRPESLLKSNIGQANQCMERAMFNMIQQLSSRINQTNLNATDYKDIHHNLITPLAKCLSVCPQNRDNCSKMSLKLSECLMKVASQMEFLTTSEIDSEASKSVASLIAVFKGLNKIFNILQTSD